MDLGSHLTRKQLAYWLALFALAPARKRVGGAKMEALLAIKVKQVSKKDTERWF